MVTFGDMMSLLLCFFVIIVSMSEIKKDERFQVVMESLRKAFGNTGEMRADSLEHAGAQHAAQEAPGDRHCRRSARTVMPTIPAFAARCSG
jgi:flagellar motor protein MotB